MTNNLSSHAHRLLSHAHNLLSYAHNLLSLRRKLKWGFLITSCLLATRPSVWITCTKFRHNCISNYDLYRKNTIETPNCSCGKQEDAYHFFCTCICKKYSNAMYIMFDKLVAPVELSYTTLGTGTIMSWYKLQLFSPVQNFISMSHRFSWIINLSHNLVFYLKTITLYPKADPGPVHSARAPSLNFFVGFVFLNFDCISRITFGWSKYRMMTLCILSFTPTKKT